MPNIPMKLTPRSKRIAAIGYDLNSATLRLKFSNGALYDYSDVPPERYQGMLSSDSMGNYFAAFIAGPDRKNPLYAYNRVNLADLLEASNDVEKEEVKPAVQESLAIVLPQAEVLPPIELDPLPSDYPSLLVHAESVRVRVQGLLRVTGVQVALDLQTPEAAKQAGELFVALTKEKKLAQALCDEDRKPHNEAYRAGLDREKAVMANYEILGTLDRALTAYRRKEEDERRQREETERKARQAQLDADTAAAAQASKAQAEREATTMEAAGQPAAAAIIRQAPVPVVAQTAAPVVLASTAPKVEGMKVVDNWKNRIDQPEQVPLYFTERMEAILHKHDDKSDAELVVALAVMFGELYSLDPVKVNGILKPKKAAGVGLIPGITVYNDQKTSTTGR